MFNFKRFLSPIFMRKLLKSFSIYTSANFINQAMPFILLPVLTRYLSPTDYGILAIFMVVLENLNIILSMGGATAVSRAYFDSGRKDFNFPRYTFNAVTISCVSFVVVFFIFLLSKPFIPVISNIPMDWLLLLPIISICAAIYMIPTKLLVFKQKPLPYVTLQLSNTLFETLLVIFFVTIIGLNWKGRILGLAINQIVFFGVGIYILFREKALDFSINYQYIKDILHFGAPLVFHSLGLAAVAAIDRFFLSTFFDFSTTGLYSVAFSITSAISIFVSSFALAWNPILYEKLKKPSALLKIKLVGFAYACFIVIFLAGLSFLLIAPFFLNIVIGEKFHAASKFINWLMLGFVFNGMYIVIAQYVFYRKKTYLAAYISVITIFLCVIFDYIFIKLNGPIGIAQAACLVFLARFLLFWYFGNRVYPMPWLSFRKNIMILLRHHENSAH